MLFLASTATPVLAGWYCELGRQTKFTPVSVPPQSGGCFILLAGDDAHQLSPLLGC
jgi:hypothetical protein